MLGLPKKALIKANRELVDLHKRCIITYLTQRSIKHKTQKKFLALYDMYISENNIRNFFHRPIKLFVYALVTNRLKEIENYMTLKSKKRKR